MRTTRIFVSSVGCDPELGCDDADGCHYRVAWAINPHMRPGASRPQRARAQWRSFLRALGDAGADVVTLPFVHGAFDSVFAKDNALLTAGSDGPRALVGRTRCHERHREQAARARVLAAHGFAVTLVDRFLEGGDIVMRPDGGALLGHGFRSDRQAAHTLTQHLGVDCVPLRLVDERLYHLDTALALLADGTALACREAFDAPSWRALQTAPSVRRVLDVPLDEALRFALNWVEIDDSVIVDARRAPVVTRLLQALGKQVVPVDLSEFRLAGGSAACLTAKVHQQPDAAWQQLAV